MSGGGGGLVGAGIGGGGGAGGATQSRAQNADRSSASEGDDPDDDPDGDEADAEEGSVSDESVAFVEASRFIASGLNAHHASDASAAVAMMAKELAIFTPLPPASR